MSEHPVKVGDETILMPVEAQEHWWKEHQLRVTKHWIDGVRGSAAGNNYQHPKYYLTLKCMTCSKQFGTVEEQQ